MAREVGTRLSISSCLCTVLYVGPVEGTSGTWLGVEWDDPSRGKHSGEHKGIRHFTTRYLLPPLFFSCSAADCRVPGAGSFIRPDRKTDGERTFLAALKEKYASHHVYEQVTLEASGKQIEMVGFDKIEQQRRYNT